MDTQLPIDLLRWGFALAPIVVLLVLLVILGWTAQQAAMIGMFTAAAIGFVVFQSPLESRISDQVARELTLRGHPVRVVSHWEGTVGHAQAIRINQESGFFEGGADPRGDGAALGF